MNSLAANDSRRPARRIVAWASTQSPACALLVKSVVRETDGDQPRLGAECALNGTSLCQAASVREETVSLIMMR